MEVPGPIFMFFREYQILDMGMILLVLVTQPLRHRLPDGQVIAVYLLGRQRTGKEILPFIADSYLGDHGFSPCQALRELFRVRDTLPFSPTLWDMQAQAILELDHFIDTRAEKLH